MWFFKLGYCQKLLLEKGYLFIYFSYELILVLWEQYVYGHISTYLLLHSFLAPITNFSFACVRPLHPS